MKHTTRSQRGSAMLMVLALTAILLTLAAAAFRVSMQNRKLNMLDKSELANRR